MDGKLAGLVVFVVTDTGIVVMEEDVVMLNGVWFEWPLEFYTCTHQPCNCCYCLLTGQLLF